MVQLMTNHQFDLQVGETIRLGDYKVTLLAVDGDGEVALEIEGPDGNVVVEPVCSDESRSEELLCV